MKRMIVLLALTIVTSTAFAQHWTNVTPPSYHDRMFSPYFLNPDLGFVFNDIQTIRSLSSLMRTTDGGKIWLPLPFFDSIKYCITQLYFVSPQHGYASAYNYLNSRIGGLYETFDQGDHWKLISKDGRPCTGVYAVDNTIFAAELSSSSNYGSPVLFSRDDGITWDSITKVSGLVLDPNPLFQLVYGNRDSLIATVYYHPISPGTYDTYLVFSTDQGQSWQARSLDQGTRGLMEALHISPHTCDIIRQSVNFQDGLNDKYSFLKSSIDYRAWNPSFMHYETGAWIAGNSCALYLSNAGFDYHGVPLYRSIDGGNSWTGLPGSSSSQPNCEEIDDGDWQNLSIVGHGAVVYAGDVIGALWKTTDGGDGTLSESQLAPQLAIGHAPFPSGNDTLAVDLCAASSLIVSYQNIGCSYASFQSFSIDGLDSSEYTWTSTHHRSCEWIPDTTFISLYPKTAGIRNLTIHTQFIDDEYNTIDSTIHVTLTVKLGSGSSVALNIYIKPATIIAAPGDTIEIPVYLGGTGQPVTLAGVTSIHIPFTFASKCIVPLDFAFTMPGVIAAGPISISDGSASIDFEVPGLTYTGETLIGVLRCIVYLADTLQTSISLIGVTLASDDPRCLDLALNTDAVTIDLQGCGDSTLLRYMKSGTLPYSIESITPNPATNTLNVKLQNAWNRPLSYELANALGVRCIGNVTASDHFALDVHNLPNGVYYLRVMAASGGAPFTRMVLIQR